MRVAQDCLDAGRRLDRRHHFPEENENHCHNITPVVSGLDERLRFCFNPNSIHFMYHCNLHAYMD